MTKRTSKSGSASDKDGMQRILLAARHEFCRAGLSGAKLDVIALEANVSKQLIHHYFRTKTELYAAMMNDTTVWIIEQLNGLDYENCEPDEAIGRFLRGLFDLLLEQPFIAGLFNDQSLHGGRLSREQVSRHPQLMERLEAAMIRGQQQGLFKAGSNGNEILAAALMITIGCFTSGKILSSFVPIAFDTDEDIAYWRDFSTKFALNALSGQAPRD